MTRRRGSERERYSSGHCSLPQWLGLDAGDEVCVVYKVHTRPVSLLCRAWWVIGSVRHGIVDYGPPMVRRTKRLWTDEEKVNLFADDGTGCVCAAGGAALRDERQLDLQGVAGPALCAGVLGRAGCGMFPSHRNRRSADARRYESRCRSRGRGGNDGGRSWGGHRLRISGASGPEALIRLIRELLG